MTEIAQRLEEIRNRLTAAAARSGRDAADVSLLVVSKTFPADAVREVYEARQRSFAESRQQEADEKLGQLPADIDWHFIGHLQRNKVRKVLDRFSTLHSVDSLRLAQYIDSVAAELGKRPGIYLQVNLAAETSKHGFSPEELRAALPLVSLKTVNVLGLMAIPPAVENPEESRHWFASLRKLRDEARATSGMELPGLSMGMSGDFEVAIEEGSTIVRVGSAIFGGRNYDQA